MTPRCPKCLNHNPGSDARLNVSRHGAFYRKSDQRLITRFRCRGCKKTFSHATFHACVNQNKRHMNDILRKLFSSGISIRRSALILKLNRKTIVRKLIFLAGQARLELKAEAGFLKPSLIVEFDDVETFEHSKCKPLSITMAVEHKTRRILGFEVSRMPAKGPLAEISRKRYGKRKDERRAARRKLFSRLKPFIDERAEFKSYQHPHYPESVKEFFPLATHKRFKSRRACIVGQGELKKGGFDPIFSFNHTAAMLRANINRLFRRTWCTTKKPERLSDHLAIYVNFHNKTLI